MSKRDLYLEEQHTIHVAEELVNSEFFEENPIAEDFSVLLSAYKKLYHQQKQLVRTGDKQLLQLNRLINQIKIILDNIPVGIVIVDENGLIQPSYSQYMHSLFNLKKISGMYIEDVLYWDDHREEERKTFKNWLGLVFDSSHDWDLIGDIGPDMIEYTSKEGQVFYRNKYHRIINKGKVTSLMIYLVDITERVRQEKIIQEQDAGQKFGMEIFSALLSQDDNNDTSDFIYETKKMLESSQQLFNTLNDEDDKPPIYDNIFRLMHSIKGLSKTYGMNELARLAHLAEEILNQLRCNDITFEKGLYDGVLASEKIPELFEMMKTLLLNAESIMQKLFKRGSGTIAATRGQRRGIKIDSEKIEELVELCESVEATNPNASPELTAKISLIKNRVKELAFQPLDLIYERLFKIVDEVSTSLKKETILNITGDKILLSGDSHHLVISSIIHLLRNSLDHGIESPEIRQASGKPPVGKIKIQTMRSEQRVMIHFEDDGAGISPTAIADKAVEKGLVSGNDIETFSDEDKINLILTPGFSSRDEVNEISGRGVGMDVVHDSMVQLGGSVKIESEINKYTRFYLSFPLTV